MKPVVKVWDPFVRLFHWTLAAAIVIAWLSADEWDALQTPCMSGRAI